jgi:hypothetical protein
MAFVKRLVDAATLGLAMFIGSGLSAPPAQAAFILTLAEQDSNVFATGSGSIDLAGLNLHPASSNAGINPPLGAITTGPVNGAPTLLFTGVTGPTSFGSGGLTYPNSGSGDTVGVGTAAIGVDIFRIVAVPVDYVSGSALSDNSTYDNQTFSSLGVTPGTYVWTWGTGGRADSFTLDIVTASVPEPSGVWLLALSCGFVMVLARVRGCRRRPTRPAGQEGGRAPWRQDRFRQTAARVVPCRYRASRPRNATARTTLD